MSYYVWKHNLRLKILFFLILKLQKVNGNVILDGKDDPHGEQEPSVPHILIPFLSNK